MLTKLFSSKKPGNGSDPETETVSSKSIQAPYYKVLLTNENDIDEYVSALKNAFLEEIKGNKRIRI